MTLSTSLLAVASLTALLPMLSLKLRPPASIRDLEKSFVVAMVTLVVGAIIVSRLHSLDFFGLVHLVYLLAVVTLPAILIGWWVLARLQRRRTLLLRLGGLVGVAAALLGVWGTHIEPNWLRTDVVSVNAAVPAPLTIGVLSDLQTPNIGRHEWKAVEMLLEQSPDIVLVPGDLYQAPGAIIAENTPDFVELLKALVAEVELVAVVSGDSDEPILVNALAVAAGATFVDNRVIEASVAGQPVRLAGVAVAQSTERLDALASLSAPSDALTIVLAHRPDVVFELPLNTDADLIVAGHTHGGQISLPFIGPPVTFSDVPRSLAAGGLEIVDRFPVYVSTGVGLERVGAPQVRLGVRPSVGIINILPR